MTADHYRLALFLVIACSVANSGSGLIVRSMDSAGGWQIIFWRSCFLAVALCVVFGVQSGGRVRAAIRELRPWALLGSVAIASVNTCFILSLTYTTVANTMFSLSAAPFFTALLGWMVLGERVERAVWVAMGVAMVGMGVMLWDGLGAGTLLGNALAVMARAQLRNLRGDPAQGARREHAAGRHSRHRARRHLRRVHERLDALDLLARHRAAGPLGHADLRHRDAVFTWASRHVPGAELTLLILIEFILAPRWVWLVIDERPSLATLIGGGLVMAAVASRAIWSFRKQAG